MTPDGCGELFEPLPAERIERYVAPLREPDALTGALRWYRRLERSDLGPAQVPVTYLNGATRNGPSDGWPRWPVPILSRRGRTSGSSNWTGSVTGLVDEVPDLVSREIPGADGRDGE